MPRILILFFLLPSFVNGQTNLSAGDLAIVNYNADNPDAISFAVLQPIDSGTMLHFTDNGWLDTGGFRSGEGFFQWMAEQSYGCGAVIDLDSLAPMALSSSGDQVLVFQGTQSNPSFITAFNNEGSAVWQSTANSTNSSALPAGLINGQHAVAVFETDNLVYSDSTQGSLSALKQLLFDSSHFLGNNTSRQSFSGTLNVQSGCQLPLVWLSSGITRSSDGLHLEWATTDEWNCSHFLLEYGSHPSAMKVFAELRAQNRSGIHNYSYPIDAEEGYYRIRQVDWDGRSTSSPLHFWGASSSTQFRIENRAESLRISAKGRFQLQLYSELGELIYSLDALHVAELPYALLPQAYGILKLRSEHEILYRKIGIVR